MPATDAKIKLPVMYNHNLCHANCPALDKWDVTAHTPTGFCRYFDEEVGYWPGQRLAECVDAETK